MSDPNRERASSASQTGTGSAFPFASTGGASRYSITREVALYVVSSTRIPFTGASFCSRDAVLTTSPATSPRSAPGLGSSATRTSPVLTAIRTSSSSSSRTQSRIASAARTARSGSSSWAIGAPKTAMTASPMNFSTVPPRTSSSVRRRS